MRTNNKTFLSNSAEETGDFAKTFAMTLPPGSVVAFFGDLAAGKTTFIKALVSKVTGISEEEINSPTFVYMNHYVGIYHFDLYRILEESEFLAMGFAEYFEMGGICLIEWAERIEAILPQGAIRVHLEHAGDDKRLITIR